MQINGNVDKSWNEFRCILEAVYVQEQHSYLLAQQKLAVIRAPEQRGTEETCSIGDVPLMPRRPTNAHKSRNLNLAINRLPNAVRYFTSTAFRLHTVTTLSTDSVSQQRLCSTARHQLTVMLYWLLSLWCHQSNDVQVTAGSYVTSLTALSFGHLLKITTFLFFRPLVHAHAVHYSLWQWCAT